MLNPSDGMMLQVAQPGILYYPDEDGVVSISENSYTDSGDLNKSIDLWDFDYHNYEFSGIITSKVMINGKLSNSTNDVLGVFVDGECRGLAQATEHPFNDNEYVFLLMAYSNVASGEKMTFSYYDAKKDFVYENIQTVKFEENMVRGDVEDSYIVSHVEDMLPTEYKLSSAYPNPFNPSTNIDFSIAEAGDVQITVYNLQGRLVTELVSGFKTTGDYSVVWNAVNMPSGVYFIQMNINGFRSVEKVMLMK